MKKRCWTKQRLIMRRFVNIQISRLSSVQFKNRRNLLNQVSFVREFASSSLNFNNHDFIKGTAALFQQYLEQRNVENVSKTQQWLTSLSDDIDLLPPLKKARLKLKIQKNIVEALEEDSHDTIEYVEEDTDYDV